MMMCSFELAFNSVDRHATCHAVCHAFFLLKSKTKFMLTFNFHIKFVILLIVNHAILIMLVQRIEYWTN